MKIKEVVERIRLLPGALVDYGFRQGRDAVLKQLNERTRNNQDAFVDEDIADMQNTIAELVQRAIPYDIPDDYIFFLEYYGGLFIEGDDYSFSILGTGPMVEDWYSSVDSDDALREVGKYGFLKLGSLVFEQYVTFFLDFAGTIQQHCVIGVGPQGRESLTPLDILKNVHNHPDKWQKVTNSFIEWLEQIAETRGTFGYV